jgi:hypothetical protein
MHGLFERGRKSMGAPYRSESGEFIARVAGKVEECWDRHAVTATVSHQYFIDAPERYADDPSWPRDRGVVTVDIHDPEVGPLVSINLEAPDALVLAELLRTAAGWILTEASDTLEARREVERGQAS